MTEEEIKAHNETIEKCGCLCHEPGVHLMHIAACCSATYQKPILVNSDNAEE